MSIESEASKRWKATENRMGLIFIFLVLVVVFVSFIAASNSAKSSSFASTVIARSSFIGSVSRVSIKNTQSVSVRYSIKNMGRSSGITNCTVYVQDAAQSFPGFDAPIVSKRIAAGHTEIGQVNVVVGTLGSKYINLGSLTCK